jgi:outer membrane protein assembly factor BamE
MTMMMRLMLAALVATLLAGCGAVYRVDVYQGNLLEARQIEQLRPGMTRRQVTLVMGSPSINSPFHANRWDYTASVQKRRGKPEVRTFSLFFEGDSLVRMEGDYFEGDNKELLSSVRKYGNLPRERDRRRGG